METADDIFTAEDGTVYLPPAEQQREQKQKRPRIPATAIEDPPELVEQARILLECSEGVDRLAAEKKVFELTDWKREGGYLSALTAYRLTKKPTHIRPKEEPVTPATPVGESPGQGDAEFLQAKSDAIASILDWERKRLAGELPEVEAPPAPEPPDEPPTVDPVNRRAELLAQIKRFEKEHAGE